ncbi:MAG TPA: IS1182 family transposase [candidate division Zixibacteria bacterium]|jgi:transposase
MQTRRKQLGYEMTLLPPLESLIPAEHRLRKLDRVLDLSFVHTAVRDRYCQDNGRPSIDPEVVMRLFILQAMEGIRSVRELMNEVQVNLAYRWFIGYRVDEPLPDHSSLSRALDRFGDALFNELFVHSIAQCRQTGLIEGRVLHLDATTIRADLDRERVGTADSPDPDARYGKFPGKRTAPGYKQQTVVDQKARVIVDVSVTSAERHEHDGAIDAVERAMTNIGQAPEAVCADAAYASGHHRAALEARGVRLVSPPPKPITHTGTEYFTTEDFAYDESRDEFTCPAGQTLRCIGPVKERPHLRRYRALRTVCRVCPLKSCCTTAPHRTLKVSVHHAALIRLRADSRTDSFRALYQARSHVIEGIFAEAKQWHGLRRAWRRGLSNMLMQSLLIAAVLNYKRLMAAVRLCEMILARAALRWWDRSDTNPVDLNYRIAIA